MKIILEIEYSVDSKLQQRKKLVIQNLSLTRKQNKKMKCPHFQKVNFQRIKQVKNDEGTVSQESNEQMKYSLYSIESLNEDIYNIPDEGIDHVNSFKTKMSNYKHAFNRMDSRQDTIKECSKIKMPKQMNIKKMISFTELRMSQPSLGMFDYDEEELSEHVNYRNASQQSSQQTQIPSEHEHSASRKHPHILVSKTSMMATDTFQIFNGVVFLDQKYENPHSCQLKDYIIKISKQQKVKYFIELQKVYVSIQQQQQNEKCLKISLKCKNKTQNIKIFFINSFQKQIFREVYLNCVKKIKQTRRLKKFLEQDKQNHNHITNFIDTNQEEQSQILNEKMEIHDQQLSESISSLSMHSYQGDSLVFETERMFFEQVKETGNTFDILLFKNKSLMSKVQRIFTNSDYDHAALLLKTASNDLLMLEATSNSGVAIYTFNSLMKIDKSKYFSRIGLRKYNGDKNLIKISRLQNFIRKTVGKKYKFDPMYLIKSQANQQKQTFFCSQLVAEALQQSGILSNQLPSFKYLPKHFAAQGLNSEVIDGKFSDIIILQ